MFYAFRSSFTKCVHKKGSDAGWVQQIQTAIRGRKPAAEKLHLSNFKIKQTEEGKPTQITCPQGQNVKVQSSRRKKSFVAHFEPDACQSCPFSQVCPAKPGKRDPRRHLRFTQAQANVAQRRRRSQIHLQGGQKSTGCCCAALFELKLQSDRSNIPSQGANYL